MKALANVEIETLSNILSYINRRQRFHHRHTFILPRTLGPTKI